VHGTGHFQDYFGNYAATIRLLSREETDTEAAGVKTDFPIVESTQPAHPSDGDDALEPSDGTP